MAYKTMLRQLISKWGIMSIDMQTAMDGDMALIKEDGSKEYVDSPEEPAVRFSDENVVQTVQEESTPVDEFDPMSI